MPFQIEVLTTEESLLPNIQKAMEPLNKVQSEFSYFFPDDDLLSSAYLFNKSGYTADDVFNWLEEYRIRAMGNRQFLILIVDKPLQDSLRNIFGTHRASKGLAVITTEEFHSDKKHFMFDLTRYIRYYLVRYSLNFLHTGIRNHEDTRGCMFDKKLYKPDILKSLDSGGLCNECQDKLREKYNIGIKNAEELLRKCVSGQIPRALILKGGGVKGLAFAGALLELEQYFTFDTFAGTSAGAITATLLGSGYTPSELLQILKQTDFGKFASATNKEKKTNLKNEAGVHDGRYFLEWLKGLLAKKVIQESEVKMKDLPKRTIVYANRAGEGAVRFDSAGERQDSHAAYATRCSMSIPGFFTPATMDGQNVYDGGIGNNFPLRMFMEDNNHKLFIGLYLSSEVKDDDGLLKNIIDIAVDGDERRLVDQYRDSIVKINPYPIETTDFSLNDFQKGFLVKCGKVAALQYLFEYHKDFQIDGQMVDHLSQELELERKGMEDTYVAPEIKLTLMQKVVGYFVKKKVPKIFKK